MHADRFQLTLWLAYRYRATPSASEVLCLFVVDYAPSPIDVIPDFIPALGYLDDMLLLPGLKRAAREWRGPPE